MILTAARRLWFSCLFVYVLLGMIYVQFDISINTYCINICMWGSYVFIYLFIYSRLSSMRLQLFLYLDVMAGLVLWVLDCVAERWRQTHCWRWWQVTGTKWAGIAKQKYVLRFSNRVALVCESSVLKIKHICHVDDSVVLCGYDVPLNICVWRWCE